MWTRPCYIYFMYVRYVPNMHAGSRSRLHELFDVGDVHSHGQHEKVSVLSPLGVFGESALFASGDEKIIKSFS